MPHALDTALAQIRAALLDPTGLRRAVAAGRRRGEKPSWVRVDLRPVALKTGARLQIVASDGVRPATRNVAWGPAAGAAVDELLSEPFGNWLVETATGSISLRVTRKGQAQLHHAPAPGLGPAPVADAPPPAPAAPDLAHDRVKRHLLDPGDPLFTVIGAGAAKRRQVDAFLRTLVSIVDSPIRTVVDLGCGNAYLTFAAYQYLRAGYPDLTVIGVDVRDDQRARNTALAHELGCADRVRFLAGAIRDAPVEGADVVLALHACDTATDEALARAIGWRARYVLAAPCCHHDLASQLKGRAAPDPYGLLTAAPILRERLADVLTDGLRAELLRLHGYQVDVVEFVDSQHTGRNLMLRARRTNARPGSRSRARYDALVDAWGLRPYLATLLDY